MLSHHKNIRRKNTYGTNLDLPLNPEENEVVIYSPTTHVSEKNKPLFTIYPNPVKTRLYLKVNSEILESIVYNSNGAEVTRFETEDVLDLGQLKPGVYHLAIQTKNGFIHERILKE